jgi:hypothetical protein
LSFAADVKRLREPTRHGGTTQQNRADHESMMRTGAPPLLASAHCLCLSHVVSGFWPTVFPPRVRASRFG